MRGPGGQHGAVVTDKAKDLKGTFKRLFGYMKPYKVGLISVILLTITGTFFTTYAPKVLAKATDEIAHGVSVALGGMGGKGIDFEKLIFILITLAVIYLFGSLFKYLSMYIMAGVSQKTIYDLRRNVDKKLRKLPLSYYDSHSYGDILSRVTNDVDSVSTSLQQSIDQIITSVTTVLLLVVMMLTISPLLTVVTLLTLPFTLLISMGVIKRSQGFFRGQQRSLGELNGHIEEMYTGHDVVKAFGKEEDVIEKFDEINEELYNYGWKAQFISSIIMPLVQFVGNVGYVIVAVVGGVLAVEGKISIGEIQAFIQYQRQFGQPINQMANIANILQSTAAAAERIFEFLDGEEETLDKETPKFPAQVKGHVQFEDVKFSYSKDTSLIEDLSMDVKPGDMLAIVGPTGAGKTTLVNLLLRFYDINSGKITIDGVDVMDMTRPQLRSLFGMVLQDTWLFSGSIMENIRYGKLDATDEEVIAAAKAAHAHGFIKALPDGYQMKLNEDATNISQGQRQLITIARAILSDPSILILDEATSSVDTRTEVLIQKAMRNLMENRTSFVIAHRLSTIKDADMILVMQEGKIVETGNHTTLLAQDGFYAQLYNSQFKANNQK